MAGDEAAAAAAALTDDQAAVYDRQLRVWGHEVQNRLSAAKVLVAGGDGLAAEVAKNLVLAGVGLVAVADDSPSTSAAFGNFLVAADTPAGTSVAEAMVKTLQGMNPLITVQVQPGSARSLGREGLAPFHTVLATGLGLAEAEALDSLCRGEGKQLFVGCVHGPLCWTFADLQAHEYLPKDKEKAAKGPVRLEYPPLRRSLATPLGAMPRKPKPSPMYQVLRVALAFEDEHKRCPGPGDVATLQGIASRMQQAEAPSPSAAQVDLELLAAYAQGEGQELAPVAAIVGGMVANHIIRAISRVDAPFKSWFLLSLLTGIGMVEDLEAHAPQ